MKSNDRIALISLGCAKNRVDSEHILGILASEGFPVVSSIEEAEIAVINTCGFLEASVEEAIDTIFEAVELKKKGQLKRVLVTGCFVQRYGYKLRREIPEVDGWAGTGEAHRIVDLVRSRHAGNVPFHIGRPSHLPDHKSPRIQTTPFYSTSLRIAEGCSHSCSYCIIPRLRGPLRSRDMDSLVVEAEEMAGRGVKEINLIAQDTTMYGADLGGKGSLEGLLEKLVSIRGIQWIRLLYCHPERISDRLLELIDSEEIICPYLDIPFQHVNGKILRAMGRSELCGVDKVLERIRGRRRSISVRSTLMVGFPGETEAMFKELCDFVSRAEFDHLGVFAFSPEKGTRAERLRPTVKRTEAEQRQERILALQSDISRSLCQKSVGQTLPVLIEGRHPETDLLLRGRTATMAPEVDGEVLINGGVGNPGDILPVLITEAHVYDLVGEIEENGERGEA
jgi:ribosomal protein S12 methylthiotransferase